MPVGGGPARPVVLFASTRSSDGAPVLTILDTDTAIAAAAGSAAGSAVSGSEEAGTAGHPSPGSSLSVGGDGDGDGGGGVGGGGLSLSREGLGAGVGEVELSTRCCSKSVFAASPHAVFVHPAGIKAFVCGGAGKGGEVAALSQGLLRVCMHSTNRFLVASVFLPVPPACSYIYSVRNFRRSYDYLAFCISPLHALAFSRPLTGPALFGGARVLL